MSEVGITNIPTLTKVPIKIFNQQQDPSTGASIPQSKSSPSSFSHESQDYGAGAKPQQKDTASPK